MSYPSNKPLPPGTYYWNLIIAGPGANGREARWPCNGAYRVAPGDTITALDVLETARTDCAREIGIPIHSATASNFTLRN
jgi:hypothetical protein